MFQLIVFVIFASLG